MAELLGWGGGEGGEWLLNMTMFLLQTCQPSLQFVKKKSLVTLIYY